MCLAIALDLCRFVKRLPFNTLLNVFLIEALSVILCADREHDAVCQIAVMRKCKYVAAGFFFVRR
jgi:hypothetical protein